MGGRFWKNRSLTQPLPLSTIKILRARHNGIFFQGWRITERLNSFQILSHYLCFMAEEVVLQICHCVYGHKLYSVTIDDIAKKRNQF